MKKLSFTLLLICLSAGIIAAQSGRRVRTPSTVLTPPSSTSSTNTSTGSTGSSTVATEEETGYSDSVPGRVELSKDRPPTLQRAGESRDSKDNKKDSKKDSKATAETAKTDSTTPAATGDDDEVIKVDSSLVSIPISVVDRNGLYIADLQKNNFKIFEDGVEQEIAYFGTTEQPFTVVLLLDVSASARYKIEEIQGAAISFVKQLKDNDTVMVISFDGRTHTLAEPTNDRETLYRAIGKARFGDSTSLYDAVDETFRRRLSKITGRKAMVLFTDGVDTSSSRASYESTVRSVEEADTVIFPVYYDTSADGGPGGGGGVMSSPYPPGFPFPGGGGGIRIGNSNGSATEYATGKRYLGELAARTGGRVYYARWESRGLEGAFANIAEELRRQYSVGYYPQETGQNGQRKQVKVRVNRPRLIVRARDSYIVGTKEGSTASTSK